MATAMHGNGSARREERPPLGTGAIEGPRELLDAASEAIFVVDAAGRCTLANASGARLLGACDPLEVVGVDVHGRLHPGQEGSSCGVAGCAWLDALGAGRPIELVGLTVWGATSVLVADCRISPMRRHGLVVGTAVSLMDVTRRHRACEVAEGTARDQERFVAMLAHELASPLQAILMASQRLRSDRRSARLAKSIDWSVARMNGLVNDLLDVARTRSVSGIRLRPRRVDVAKACRMALLELRSARAGATIRLGVQGDTRCSADPDRLGQVIVNLIGNALDHGDSRAPVQVTVSGEEDWVTLAVHNEGAPIPEADLPHLFEPFRRGQNASGRRTGLGLGLYIARAIVEAHGGTVAVGSSAEEGTTFHVTLPRGR